VTEDRPLSVNGKNKEIFLSALRDFSDSCQAPELTPHCPFFERTAQGPGCAEQCQDILAEHNVSRADVGLDLGGGLALHVRRRRRPRRGPDESARPFDAVEMRLRDKDRPTDAKHTVSILGDVFAEISLPPAVASDADDRRYVVEAGFDELVRRGFDRELLLATLAERLARSVLVWTGLPLVFEDDERKHFEEYFLDSGWPLVLEDWKQSEAQAGSSDLDLFVKLVRGPMRDLSRRWLHSLSLGDLLAWKAPAQLGDMEQLPVVEPYVRNRASWLNDRFTTTYLYEWSDASLHLEWAYVHGDRAGCSVPRQMAVRKVEAADLARELAHRSTEEWRKTGSPESRSFQAADFVHFAAEKLQTGQSEAATGIYEGLYALSPDDADIANNLGFCLVPHDPGRALEILDRAWSMRGQRHLVTLANRVFVLRLLGRVDDAVKEAALQLSCDPHPQRAYLWTADEDGGLRLVDDQDPSEYISRIRLEIEEAKR
jgi:hypothetical protein